MSLLIRVRTQVGTWRLTDVKPTDTIEELKIRLETEHRTELLNKPITKDASGSIILPFGSTVASLGLVNGDMIYASVNESKTGVHESAKATSRFIKDGNIVAKEYAVGSHNGFRPGMMALKSMKMQWTLNDFIALDEQFVYKPKQAEKAFCTQVSIDESSIEGFNKYLFHFNFMKIRVGYLYGSFEKDNSVKVECIYEPPQENTDTSFNLLDDPHEDRVQAVTALLGLKKVGWILAHPPRESMFHMSGSEVIFAAEQQLECANGIEDTPFVTVKVTLGEDSNPVVEGFQVSKQCMEMVAEGVISPAENLGCTAVNPTYTVIIEGKETKEIDNNFLLANVAIVKHKSSTFIATFPRMNREMEVQTRDDLKFQLNKVGKQGWTFTSVISDINLLLFLCDYIDISTDIPVLCNSIMNPDIPIEEGYQLIIRSVAGIDM